MARFSVPEATNVSDSAIFEGRNSFGILDGCGILDGIGVFWDKRTTDLK
jgi:hypothetical protein